MDRARRRFLTAGTAALIARAVPAAAQAPDLPSAAERAAIAADAAAFLAAHGVPALSVAFVRGGTPVHVAAFGLADRRSGEVATPAHRFRIASVSKPVTAVAVLQLVAAGRLALDAPVFGPDGALGAAGADVPAGSPLRGVTVDHLLTHLSGAWPNDRSDPMFDHPGADHARLIALALRQRAPLAAPGSTFMYSNFGYCLLGRIIERVAGRPYEAHVRDAVLAPAGAGGMRVGGNMESDRLPDEVRYHGVGNDLPYAHDVRRMDSHGGWVATAAEAASFVAAAFGRTPRPPLDAAWVRRMAEPTVPGPDYARGWRVNRAGNCWHTGSLPGTAAIAVATRGGMSWAGLANSRARGTSLAADLDRLMWTMARRVPAWRA
jgi:CubicO group peptidase (beta-lactamase class C family)